MESIGEVMVSLRGEKSQAKVATDLGISISALSMYENNQRVPRDEIKLLIAQYYGKTVQEIFFDPKVH